MKLLYRKEVNPVPDYQKMYFALFNAITDTIDVLQKVQQATEEIYISEPDPIIKIIPSSDSRKNENRNN